MGEEKSKSNSGTEGASWVCVCLHVGFSDGNIEFENRKLEANLPNLNRKVRRAKTSGRIPVREWTILIANEKIRLRTWDRGAAMVCLRLLGTAFFTARWD